MPGQSLTQVIGGPCLITYRGATFRSKGDVTLNQALSTFPIETSVYGQVDERVNERPVRLTFVPDGEWTNLGVLWPYAAFPFGSYITPQQAFGAIAASQITIPGHLFTSGDAIVAQVQGTGTITVGLVAGQTYYVHVINANTVSLMNTYADAVAGTNPVTISAGTGRTVSVVNNPLQIQTLDGYLWTFLNAAVTRMPGLNLSTVTTAIKEVEFEAFVVDGQDWSGTNSLYTYAANPWPGDPGFNPQNILTGEIQATWGSTPPWTLFDTKTGWDVEFAMELTPVEVDNVGLITRRLSNLVVTARSIPIGVQPSDVATAIRLQGANSARGMSLAAAGNNLLLSATANNLGCKLFNAALRGGPSIFSNKLDRIGELIWVATRTFNSTGPNPLFFIGNTQVT